MASFNKKVQNFAFQYDLWDKGSKIILAVSGGPDSMCMLNFFHELSKKYELSLHVAHVNYGLRGQDSEKDEALVKKTTEKLGIGCSVLKAKKSKQKGNLEENLREIRYEFFETLRKKLGFELIAVAHNQDDQAETVLMRMMRGSGLNGLSAIRPKSGVIIRPFLKTSRKEIMAYLKEKDVPYRNDSTNSEQQFTRNRVRHGLLPYLEEHFNPAVKKNLSELALCVSGDYEYISRQAERFAFLTCTNKCIRFGGKEFLKKHPALQNQILRNVWQILRGTFDGLEGSHLEEIIKLIKSEKNKSKNISIGGLNISKKGDTVEILRIR